MGLKKMIGDYKRKEKRVQLVGSEGVNRQDARRKKINKLPKQVTRDVQKRMKEYRTGVVGTGEADAHSVEGRKGYKRK